MEASGDPSPPFEVSSASETAVPRQEFEGLNVSRVAALSTLLGGDTQSVRELVDELQAIGLPPALTSGERSWGNANPLETFAGLRDQFTDGDEFERVRGWQMIGETAEPQAAVAFLVAVLGSHLERESAAAAAALWRHIAPVDPARLWRGPRRLHLWDRLYDLWEPGWPEPAWWGPLGPRPGWPELDDDLGELEVVDWAPEEWNHLYRRATSRLGDPYSDILIVNLLTTWRLNRALRSPDPVTHSLAAAAFPPSGDGEREERPPASRPSAPPGALVVSTMIHGTWGWKGDWWRPRGDFHEFILRNHRPNLYSRGAKFSWSGAYRDAHRATAATDFLEWAYDVAPNGLQSVFAHSYGGEIGARAVLNGGRISELVLLSAPVTDHVDEAARSGARVVDVRLRFDAVLGLARRRQRVRAGPNVVTVLLDKWRLDHGATHREYIWREENVAMRGGI